MNVQQTNETVREYLAKATAKTDTTVSPQPSWTTRVINSSQLKSKQDYQRRIDMKFVRDCIANFNPDKVEPIHVSYRDGKYYVMDGQHTILILEGVNGNKPVDVNCIVHKGMNYSAESDWTVDQYEKKHHHTYAEIAVASYEAGRRLPCEIAAKIRNVGGKLPYDKSTKTGMKINAVKKLTSFYQKDADNTVLAIQCLIEAYKGRETSLSADMIAGTMEFLHLYQEKILVSRLVEALSKYTPQLITNTAKNLKMTYPINWTETLRDKYNGISKRGKIKPIYNI